LVQEATWQDLENVSAIHLYNKTKHLFA
jgi:hypothetical protein